MPIEKRPSKLEVFLLGLPRVGVRCSVSVPVFRGETNAVAVPGALAMEKAVQSAVVRLAGNLPSCVASRSYSARFGKEKA